MVWASWQDRDARSAGFFRRALDERNVIQIYPDGFLPIIAPAVTDLSAAGGVRWSLGEYRDMDSSLAFGSNEMEFTIEHVESIARTREQDCSSTPAASSIGSLCSMCPSVHGFDMGLASPVNIAVGVEARQEKLRDLSPASRIRGATAA